MAVTVRSRNTRPGQAGRSSPWRLLAVVVLLAVVAAGAWLGGRTTAPTGSSDDAADPGPTGSEAGVPVGYAHSEAGAAAAAMNLLTALYGPGLGSDRQDRVLDVLAADEAEQWITDHLREIDADPPQHLQGRVWRWSPLGYEVTSYTDDRAAIEVWGSWSRTSQTGRSLGSSGPIVARVEVVWEGDWRVSRVGTAEARREGLAEDLDAMGGVWHAPAD